MATKPTPTADPKKLVPSQERELPHKVKKDKPRRLEKGKRRK